MVYLFNDGRQLTDRKFIQEGEHFIEIPDFINPVEEDGFVTYVVGIEDGKPKYEKTPIVTPQPELSQLDRIERAVNLKNEDIANAAVDAFTLELMEGGVI